MNEYFTLSKKKHHTTGRKQKQLSEGMHMSDMTAAFAI